MNTLGPSLRRTRRRATRVWRRCVAGLAISLSLNFLVLKNIGVDWLKGARVSPDTERAVSLAPLSASQWAANRTPSVGAAPHRSVPPPAVPPPAPAPPRVPGQVVDVEHSNNDAAPKESRFVSDRNNTVEKETRSRSARPGYASTLAKPSQAGANRRLEQGGAPSKGTGGERGAGGDHAQSVRQDPAPPLNAKREGGSLLAMSAPPPRNGGSAGEAGSPGMPGSSGHLDLRPGAASYEQLAGGPAPDHLEGVEEGEGTYLNTREWKYAGYFNRIKQAVAAQWLPSAAMASRDPGGSKFGYKDWNTLLSVKLDGTGVLKQASVARSSGLDFLDSTAVDAFQRAQPFANPPPGLADNHGEIVFTFGFYLETGSHGFRLLKGPPLPQ